MQEPEASGRSETALVDPERHVESFRQAREAVGSNWSRITSS